MLKTCTNCGRELDISEFPRQGTSTRAWCSDCHNNRQREYNKERGHNKTYYARNKEAIQEKAKSMHWRRQYGLTEQDYWNLVEAQENLCAICKQPETRTQRGKTLSLCVDHCHRTGVVRGLLCSNCNRAIGLLHDDPSIVASAYYYLTGE